MTLAVTDDPKVKNLNTSPGSNLISYRERIVLLNLGEIKNGGILKMNSVYLNVRKMD